jgi:hypothetical protein
MLEACFGVSVRSRLCGGDACLLVLGGDLSKGVCSSSDSYFLAGFQVHWKGTVRISSVFAPWTAAFRRRDGR